MKYVDSLKGRIKHLEAVNYELRMKEVSHWHMATLLNQEGVYIEGKLGKAWRVSEDLWSVQMHDRADEGPGGKVDLITAIEYITVPDYAKALRGGES
jgi:hypothetical protein